MCEHQEPLESRIATALEWYNEGFEKNIAELGRYFDIPYGQLRGRIQGRQPRKGRAPTHQRLSNGEEDAILGYLDRLDRLGLSATREQLRGAANYLISLQKDGGDFQPVGQHWVKRFLNRHPEYKVRAQKVMEKERKRAENRMVIANWYKGVLQAFEDYGINPEDIWNMDESGFMIGYGRDETVITKNHNQNTVGFPQLRESATLVEAVSAAGRVIPPMIILKGKCHMAKWYDESVEMDDEALIAVSDSGYTNDELSLAWIEHFELQTRDYRVGRYRILFLDGYGSHLTYRFIQHADEHDILLIAFPPHTTHILQPLDVVVFQPYKHYHAKAVAEAVRLGFFDFKKLDFLGCLSGVRRKTFKSGTIQSAFEKTGIWPFNPHQVLSKIPSEHDPLPSNSTSRPQTPPSQYSLATAVTPGTINRLKRHTQALELRIKRDYLAGKADYELANGIIKLSKAAVSAKSSYILACKDLRRTKLAEAIQSYRKAQKNRQLQAGGIIRMKDGRAMKKKRDAKDNKG